MSYYYYHFESKLSKRFQMEKDKYCLVPVNQIVDHAFCISDDSCIDDDSDDAIGNIAINIDLPNKWSTYFIKWKKIMLLKVK